MSRCKPVGLGNSRVLTDHQKLPQTYYWLEETNKVSRGSMADDDGGGDLEPCWIWNGNSYLLEASH